MATRLKKEEGFLMSSSMPVFSRYLVSNSLLCFFSIVSISFTPARSGDAEALLALKASVDPLNKLNWWSGNAGNICQWEGVKECRNGRITKLVVEGMNLSGRLDQVSLNQLDQLRVLSFKENSISGQIPNLSGLVNLKSLFLNDNNFTDNIPSTLSIPHRLKVVVLSNNQITGHIPDSLANLPRLYVLYLQNNLLTGGIPPFQQTSLRFLNVSNNQLSGPIPSTSVLTRFNDSTFFNNIDLCGDQIHRPCKNPNISLGPSTSPSYPVIPNKQGNHRRNKKLIIILVPSIIGGVILFGALAMAFALCIRRSRAETETREARAKAAEAGRGVELGSTSGPPGAQGKAGGGGGGGGGFSWDERGEGLGTLVFCGPGDQQMSYSLEDLLKASAETLGRGTIGSTYKAVMESGYIVTVKRLKEARYPTIEEFRRHVELIGKLRHPNVVPLRSYFQAKEERLLVYDYFPNGSLFSLIHGSRASGGSKPLHWTSCLKIAEDLATGLLYIHQNPGLVHGNLKSSNVLLGSDFESCLTDYSLTSFRNPDSLDESSASSLFYRAPECRDIRKPLTQPADVYSFGVLVLELLTGKTPFQDLVQEHGSDIPRWVRSVREEEIESGDEPASSTEASEEKLAALLNIAMTCVSLAPENRPTMKDVLRMIREARAEAQVSSNSSDHSPGRWSDTVQSLPRDEHLSI